MISEQEKRSQLTMPYEEKVQRSKELILEWYLQYKGNVYVSFSGGKDSLVLLHIARSIKGCSDIVGVFSDTGLEFPEIRNFVKKFNNIIWIKPKLTFKQVIDKYGYPIISKEQSCDIYEIRTTKSDYLRNKRLGNGCGHLAKKWYPLINSDFKISNRCCSVMKKQPMKSFENKTGLKPMVATMASESSLRYQKYMIGNCNEFSAKHPVSKPMSFWNEQDVLRYIVDNGLEIADVYGKIEQTVDGRYYTTGRDRTGCMFCMYGVHLEGHPNRFEKMKETHPYQYNYIMNKLNGKHVLDEYLKCAGDQPNLL